jgi:cysteine desulfurase
LGTRTDVVPGKSEPIYLDWNATTPVHPDVVRQMVECGAEAWGNPSSVHWFGRQARERVEQARAEIAGYFSVHPRDVVYVSGGTEANNLALLDAPALVTSIVEHPSVVRVARELSQRRRPVHWLSVNRFGQVDLESLQRALAGLPSGAVVAVQAVNHETGVIQPLSEVAELAHRAGAWLHVDAVQALGKIRREEYLCGDSFAIAAHKIRGPKGIGAMIWRCGRTAPRSILFGGSQQRGLRPGTLDPIAVVGMAAALSRITRSEVDDEPIAQLRDRLESDLAVISEPNVIGAPRVGHVSSLRVPGWRADELVAALDVERVCVSSGSACSAGTAEVSPVIRAMVGDERAAQTIRISLGETTTEAEITRACDVIRRVVERAAHAAASASRGVAQDLDGGP